MSKYHRKKNKNGLLSILANFLISLEETVNIKKETFYENTHFKQNEQNTLKLTTSFLLTIDWKNYENLCIEYLLIKNCNAKPTSMGADGGIDITITNSKHQLIGIAQCKAWSRKISVNLVRELFGVMASEQVEKGIFFTTSAFTLDAIAFCHDKKILLVDGNEFINRISKLAENQQAQLITIATKGDYTIPTCARCDKKMVMRVSKKGENIGRKFWGCCDFPRCRSVINIRQ
ncbi:MAG: restriction endonuclease [Methylococcales bacterium]|nr:restriction endonuclease [Methylococcales bacterium]